ncbi:DedA family protein [Gloeobacter morelensis]|uniref:VTT domain-containing protein n=1 Tax=Gloeobacter morelensis MG652769 TaxID=2781736 RepID=A0ABY3PIJ9_9CYAN|nr:VTT domain-containing protein [Gloeobacter morelensis]UFP93357.1 VTT domain-containing protein [Gloeobacter morelensis MG652769]
MEPVLDFFRYLGNFEELIRAGGYVALTAIIFVETGLLIGFFLPGDSLLVAAGVLIAATGLLNIWVLAALLCTAAIVGDTVGYWIGAKAGPRLFSREKSLFFAKDHLIKAERFYTKYGAKTILLARWVPIVRTFAPVVAGAARMHYPTFLLFNVVGGVTWIGSLLIGSYFLGQLIPDLEKNVHIAVAVVVLLSILPPIIEYLKARREPDASR